MNWLASCFTALSLDLFFDEFNKNNNNIDNDKIDKNKNEMNF